MTEVAISQRAPPLGLSRTLGFVRAFMADPPSAFLEMHRQAGSTFSASIPGYRLISTIDRQIIDHVLRHHPERFGKGRHGDTLAPLWGRSTVQISDGPDWERQRSVMLAFFSIVQAPETEASIKRRTAKLLTDLETAAIKGDVVPLYERLRDAYWRALCDIWLGPVADEEMDGIASILREGTNLASRRMLNLFNLPLEVPTPANVAVRRIGEQLHSHLDRLLERGKSDLSAMPIAALSAAPARSPPAMTQQEARNNLALLLLAAYEFPSLGWTLQKIGQHDDIRARVLQETAGAVSANGGISFLECCFRETLRLMPPSPMLGREIVTSSSAAGIELPAGHTLVVPVIALHRDAGIWKEPDAFRPDRFLESVPSGAYLPFGAGPRGCIGQTLTRQLDRLIVNPFFAAFDYTLVSRDTPDIQDRLKSYPKGGVPVRLHRR